MRERQEVSGQATWAPLRELRPLGVGVGVNVWSQISQLEERVAARGIGGGHHIRVLAIVIVEDRAF